MTPFECYGGTPRWKEIIERVGHFNGDYRIKDRKLRLFGEQGAEDIKEFSQSCLNDSRYIARLALKYLGVLYGAVNGITHGEDEDSGKRILFASTGRVTAILRREWELNEILLGDSKQNGEDADIEKNRNDHRHHAIDALVISLSTAKIIQKLSSAAKESEFTDKKRLLKENSVQPPITGFKKLVRQVVDTIVVSKRIDSKVRGQLHEETNLGAKTYPDPFTKKQQRKKRVPVAGISAKQLDSVVDPGVRRAIKEKLQEVGDAKKLADNPPRLPSRNNNFGVLIVKTVVWETSKPIQLSKGRRARLVKPGDNHHIEFYAILDDDGKEKELRFNLVTLYEAHKRKREHSPIVKRDFGENTKFMFSLVKGDAIREKTTGKIYFVRGLSSLQDDKYILITGALNNCAKPITELANEYSQWQKKQKATKQNDCSTSSKDDEPGYLRSTNIQDFLTRFEKVRISPLGEVTIEND